MWLHRNNVLKYFITTTAILLSLTILFFVQFPLFMPYSQLVAQTRDAKELMVVTVNNKVFSSDFSYIVLKHIDRKTVPERMVILTTKHKYFDVHKIEILDLDASVSIRTSNGNIFFYSYRPYGWTCERL